MFFKSHKEGLLDCKVVHKLKGRMRVQCRAFRYLEEQKSSIEEAISSIKGVREVKITPLTANILIRYESSVLEEKELLKVISASVANYSLIAYKGEKEFTNTPIVNERTLTEESIPQMLSSVAVIGGVLLISILKRRKIPFMGMGLFSRLTTLPALTTIVLSLPIFRSGLHSLIKTKKPNADTLSATAIAASLLAGRDISALTVIFLHEIAELLTAFTMKRTRQAIRGMLDTGESRVWIEKAKGGLEQIPVEEVQVNDTVVVHSGEKISVDGTVIRGSAVIDQSSITGEFLPATKEIDSEVFAGTVVKSGTISIRAEKVGDHTAVSRIIHMVEDASSNKAAIQTYADRFSALLIPLNFTLAAVMFLLTGDLQKTLNMLIIDYSCGIRLSTAAAFSAAISNAARHGVLIKGSNFIEAITECDTLILDKTGTLTEGDPIIRSIHCCTKEYDERYIIERAAAAEQSAKHPLSIAILNRVRYGGWKIPEHGEIKIHTALGVETTVEGKTVRVGNRRFMELAKINTEPAAEFISSLIINGESIIYVAEDSTLLGVVGVTDPLRENMKKALNRLRNVGIDDIVLLTGDHERQAQIVAEKMAMDRFESELLPEDKAKAVLDLQLKGSKVIMVGDGINDAPALAYADVGIAIGNRRTDIAMESSDITITGDNPIQISSVVSLSDKTMQIIRQNFIFAIGINSIGLALGALGVLPVFWGAVLHNSSTIMVVGNSLRLLIHDMDRKGRTR